MTGLFSRGLFSRSGWGRVMAPVIRWLVKHGVTANTVTVVGTLGAMAGALAFYSRGVFFVGTLIIWAFAMLDFVDGSVVSYVKARAEGAGLRCDVGLIERPQRLTTALAGTGLDGLGVPYVQAVALWALVALSAYTAWQRLVEVHRQSRAVQQG